MLDVNHSLYKLSESLDWVGLERDIVTILGSRYAPVIRLVCGTVYIKSFFELSTAEVIEKWSTCPYCCYFCHGDAAQGAKRFPISEHSLDMLISQLTPDVHDIMVKALLATSIASSRVRNTLSAH